MNNLKYVVETKREQCPACGFPTRIGDTIKGEYSNISYMCDEIPDIRTRSKYTIDGVIALVYFEFTCSRCTNTWTETSDEHNQGGDAL